MKLRSVAAAILALALCACSTTKLGENNPAPLDTSPKDLALLDRVTWGGNTAGAQTLAAQGTAAFLDAQLHPTDDDGLPAGIAAQIAALTITQKSPEEIEAGLRDERAAFKTITDPDQNAAAKKAYQGHLNMLGREAAQRSLLRDLYSKNQLKEQMAWFWFNHFNVSQNKAQIRALVGDYEDRAIRPHVFGHFRDLLAATLHHPAMLLYLDNAQNAAGHLNENYAREIMELHTLGVDGGYTQADVEELARILTGVGINQSGKTPNVKPVLKSQYIRDGLFEFNPNRHDYGDKVFLGRRITGRGYAEVDEALDILCAQPATARFISRKIAVFLVSDNPSSALVDTMASVFRQTNGDIAAVLSAMFASREFNASLGSKFKDPMHFVVSAVRLTSGDRDVQNPTPLLGWLNRLGEPLYGRETPDGYPLTEAAWSASGDMETRFEIARIIGSGRAPLFGPAGAKTPNDTAPLQIDKMRYAAAQTSTFGRATADALAQAKTPGDRNMLFLSSPEFMHR